MQSSCGSGTAFRCKARTSTYFLALSQAPPVLDMDTAICTPETKAPARRPASVRVPKRTPTTTGESMTKQPGGIISEREAYTEPLVHFITVESTSTFRAFCEVARYIATSSDSVAAQLCRKRSNQPEFFSVLKVKSEVTNSF